MSPFFLGRAIHRLQHLFYYFAGTFLIGDLKRQLVHPFGSIILLRLIIEETA